MDRRRHTGLLILAGFTTGIALLVVHLCTTFIGLNKMTTSIAELGVIVVCQVVYGRIYARAAEGIGYMQALMFMAAAVFLGAVLVTAGDMAVWRYAVLAGERVDNAMFLAQFATKGFNLFIIGVLAGLFTSTFIYKRK